MLFHKDKSWAFERTRNLDQALQEAQIAYYEVEYTLGHVQEKKGDYIKARFHYERALASAQLLNYTKGLAKVYDRIAILAAQSGKFSEAEQHWEKACQLAQEIGDLITLGSFRVNQAFQYILAEQYASVIEPAKEGWQIFSDLGMAYHKAAAAQNLAEAYVGLNRLPEAETYAQQVIDCLLYTSPSPRDPE